MAPRPVSPLPRIIRNKHRLGLIVERVRGQDAARVGGERGFGE